jgi:hypothetical protein
MRYIFLLLLNLPIICLALLNIVTQFKLKRISKNKLIKQFALWIVLLTILILSFPLYNLVSGNAILDASELSLFDIIETTAIIFLLYVLNRQRQALESNDRRIRDLHQELSINMAISKHGKS